MRATSSLWAILLHPSCLMCVAMQRMRKPKLSEEFCLDREHVRPGPLSSGEHRTAHFFILPSPDAEALGATGPVEAALSTSNETVTLPAFSNSRVIGTWVPFFIRLLRFDRVRWIP